MAETGIDDDVERITIDHPQDAGDVGPHDGPIGVYASDGVTLGQLEGDVVT